MNEKIITNDNITTESVTTSNLKAQAKALRAYLAEQGIEIGHSKALEAIARCHGMKDWNTASARVGNEPESRPMLKVWNVHIPDCGSPPSFTRGALPRGDTSPRYLSYFENDYGEQLIYSWDGASEHGKLHHGDCGWETAYEVDGQGRPYEGEEWRMAGDLILANCERIWLRACAMVVSNRKHDE